MLEGSKNDLSKSISDNDSKGVSVDDICSFSPEPEMLVVVPDILVFPDFNSEASSSNSIDLLSHRCDYSDRGSDGVGGTDPKTTVSRSDCVSGTNNVAKRFECKLCDKTFLREWNLERHRRLIHLKIKSFECMFCSKVFPTKEGLKQHELAHTKSEFVCDVCGSTHKYLSNLRRHKLVHENKLFTCGKKILLEMLPCHVTKDFTKFDFV